MELRVLAVGQRMPDWVAAGWNEYARRMPPHLLLNLDTVAGAGRSDDPAADEAERLAKRLPEPGRIIALEPGGKPWTTDRLAGNLADWQHDGDPVIFLVGGADGLHADLVARAHQRWSLSPLTLPHMLVRVVVAEQLYRAWSITANHPYHRG